MLDEDEVQSLRQCKVKKTIIVSIFNLFTFDLWHHMEGAIWTILQIR